MMSNLYNRCSTSAGMGLVLLALVSLASSLGVGISVRAAESAESADLSMNPSLPAPADAMEAMLPLDRHRYNDLFSIGFPADWQVTQQDGEPQLVALADAPNSSPLRTEVTWVAAPPQQVVSQALQEIQVQGHTVALYDAIAMDGTSAIRLWLTDLPDAEAPSAFVSYVGYANGTAKIITYYRDRTPEQDNLLSQVHQSFQRMAPSAPEADLLDDAAPQNETGQPNPGIPKG